MGVPSNDYVFPQGSHRNDKESIEPASIITLFEDSVITLE